MNINNALWETRAAGAEGGPGVGVGLMVVFQTQRFVYTYTATVVCACGGGIYAYIRLFCWRRTSPKLARCAGTVLVFKTPNPVLINIRFVRPTDFCVKTAAAVVRPYPTPPVCPSVRLKYKGLTDTFVPTDIKLNFSHVINNIKLRINNNYREFHAN